MRSIGSTLSYLHDQQFTKAQQSYSCFHRSWSSFSSSNNDSLILLTILQILNDSRMRFGYFFERWCYEWRKMYSSHFIAGSEFLPYDSILLAYAQRTPTKGRHTELGQLRDGTQKAFVQSFYVNSPQCPLLSKPAIRFLSPNTTQ